MSVPSPWFDPDDDRMSRAAWSRMTEPDDLGAARLVTRYGAGPALGLVLSGGDRTVGVEDRWRARVAGLDPRRDLATLDRFRGRLIVPGDPEWPSLLDSLGERRPFCLWARGAARLSDAARRAAAIVGARASTEYGEHTARELAFGCAERGISVVSGAAYGIDAAAHLGALACGGPTVAVLACGVDRPYPRGNVDLIERIADEGLVVSEVPPGSAPTRNRFVHRNRLIAALAAATVIVEAGWRSGASITAKEADALGRCLGAVPGPVTSAASAGCHRLLRDGAICVTTAAEVAELVDPIGSAAVQQPPLVRALHDDLPEVDLRVLDALPLRQPRPSTSLAAVAGLDLPTLAASLGRLELLGLAVRTPRGWRRSPTSG